MACTTEDTKRQTRSLSDERISVKESPHITIIRALKERGYIFADHDGVRCPKTLYGSVGVLKPREPVSDSFLGIKYTRRRRALHIGTIYYDNSCRGAKEDTNWVVSVYGREFVREMTGLTEEVLKSHPVKADIRLEHESPRIETYESEHGY